MTREHVIDWVEGIIFGGVAITASALTHAAGGQELTFTQWRALLFVGEGDDGCRVGEVASRLHASLPTASRLLRRLERRGLLTLERDEHDRRATRARLTAVGIGIRSAVLAYRRDEIAALIDQANPPASADAALRSLALLFDGRGHQTSATVQPPGDSGATA